MLDILVILGFLTYFLKKAGSIVLQKSALFQKNTHLGNLQIEKFEFPWWLLHVE